MQTHPNERYIDALLAFVNNPDTNYSSLKITRRGRIPNQLRWEVEILRQYHCWTDEVASDCRTMLSASS